MGLLIISGVGPEEVEVLNAKQAHNFTKRELASFLGHRVVMSWPSPNQERVLEFKTNSDRLKFCDYDLRCCVKKNERLSVSKEFNGRIFFPQYASGGFYTPWDRDSKKYFIIEWKNFNRPQEPLDWRLILCDTENIQNEVEYAVGNWITFIGWSPLADYVVYELFLEKIGWKMEIMNLATKETRTLVVYSSTNKRPFVSFDKTGRYVVVFDQNQMPTLRIFAVDTLNLLFEKHLGVDILSSVARVIPSLKEISKKFAKPGDIFAPEQVAIPSVWDSVMFNQTDAVLYLGIRRVNSWHAVDTIKVFEWIKIHVEFNKFAEGYKNSSGAV